MAALLLSVALCMVSFMLLIFPAIAGCYYAVQKSRRETHFIDLSNILRTSTHVLRGMRIHFFSAFARGLCGLVPALLLFISPAL